MIQAILVFNNHGKPRLVRFYQRFVSAARAVTAGGVPRRPLTRSRAPELGPSLHPQPIRA